MNSKWVGADKHSAVKNHCQKPQLNRKSATLKFTGQDLELLAWRFNIKHDICCEH